MLFLCGSQVRLSAQYFSPIVYLAQKIGQEQLLTHSRYRTEPKNMLCTEMRFLRYLCIFRSMVFQGDVSMNRLFLIYLEGHNTLTPNESAWLNKIMHLKLSRSETSHVGVFTGHFEMQSCLRLQLVTLTMQVCYRTIYLESVVAALRFGLTIEVSW